LQGVVLLEIAFWKDAISLSNIPKTTSHGPARTVIPEHIRTSFEDKSKKNLPHQVGQVFTDTILACFRFEEDTDGLGDYEMHRFFEVNIRDKLGRTVGRLLG